MNETVQLILDNHKDFAEKREVIDKLADWGIISKKEQSDLLERVVESYKK